MKTISGHLGTKYSVAHNNRIIISDNVDPARISNNENSVTAGGNAATISQIYNKVFEPAWQEFQSRQRKSRKYSGTYLEYVREKRAEENEKMAKEDNPAARHKTAAEAYEIVWTIGDMDNTGYKAAPEDAAKAEELLRDFNKHLLENPNICVVTQRELDDPEWKPPFKAGLIMLNLTAHFDEATPGVHSTFIPYCSEISRGCSIQNAISRTFGAMGYSVEFQEARDDDGELIPRTDKDGNILKDKEGNPLYKKALVSQGALDWIEEQKQWLQREMLSRYGWEREYKGKHERGDLSTPDYQVARAKERLQEAQERLQTTEEELQATQLELADKTAEAAALKVEVDDLRERLDETSQDLSAVRGELAQTKEQVKEQEARYLEILDANEKNMKVVEENAAVIEQQEQIIEEQREILHLIQNYDEYLDEAAEIEQDLDEMKNIVEEMPREAKPFHQSAASRWLKEAEKWIQRLRKLIEAGISRLKIFERDYAHEFETKERLSTPIEQRKRDLDAIIFGAEEKAQEAALEAQERPKNTIER